MTANSYLTVAEAAALRGVAAMTIYRALWNGKFPNAQAIGSGTRKVWLLPREDVEQWKPGPSGHRRGEKKVSTIAVKGRFPVNAHPTVPRDTPTTVVSRHRYTRRGAANALRSLVSVRDGYAASHGNAAAFLVWVEVDGQSIDPVDLEVEFGPF